MDLFEEGLTFFFHRVQEQLVQVHFYYELIMELVEE